MSKEIQFAKPEDIPQIIALAYLSFHENLLEEKGESEDFIKVSSALTEAVFNHVVLVKRSEEDPKIIEGVFAFKIAPKWYSNDNLLISLFFFIKKPKRSFKLLRLFLNAVKEYAIMNRLPVVFDFTFQKDVNKKVKLFKYLGFKEYGSLLGFNRD